MRQNGERRESILGSRMPLKILYSEGMQRGWRFGDLVVTNPFLPTQSVGVGLLFLVSFRP